MYFLLDDYTSHGTDIDSFKKEAELFDKHTSIIPVYTCDMHILDYFKISPTKVLFHDIKDDQLTYTEDGKYIVTDMMAIRTDSLSEEQGQFYHCLHEKKINSLLKQLPRCFVVYDFCNNQEKIFSPEIVLHNFSRLLKSVHHFYIPCFYLHSERPPAVNYDQKQH